MLLLCAIVSLLLAVYFFFVSMAVFTVQFWTYIYALKHKLNHNISLTSVIKFNFIGFCFFVISVSCGLIHFYGLETFI